MNLYEKSVNLHFLLNLDYPLNYKGINLDTQTNQLINTIINELNSIVEANKNHIFVYEYRDDLISLIGLKILKNLSTVNGMQFYLLGPHKQTKKLVKNENFISKFKVKRNLDNIYLISSFNSIYKVGNYPDFSKKFGFKWNDVYQLLNKFTPAEFLKAAEFYGIDFKLDEFKTTNELYQKWVTNPIQYFSDEELELLTKVIEEPKYPRITAVWLTGDLDTDRLYLEYCVNTNDIVFYYSEGELPIYKDSSYDFEVKYRDNIPKMFNINQDKKLLSNINLSHNPINVIGKWPVDKYLKFTEELK